MSRVWLIARHHLSQEASKRSFLLVLFSLPLFLTATIGLSLLLAQARENHVVLGYVDPGGFLAGVGPVDAAEEVTLRPFAKEDDARAALEEEQIAGYYLLPSAYPESQQVEIIFYERTASVASTACVRRPGAPATPRRARSRHGLPRVGGTRGTGGRVRSRPGIRRWRAPRF